MPLPLVMERSSNIFKVAFDGYKKDVGVESVGNNLVEAEILMVEVRGAMGGNLFQIR